MKMPLKYEPVIVRPTGIPFEWFRKVFPNKLSQLFETMYEISAERAGRPGLRRLKKTCVTIDNLPDFDPYPQFDRRVSAGLTIAVQNVTPSAFSQTSR